MKLTLVPLVAGLALASGMAGAPAAFAAATPLGATKVAPTPRAGAEPHFARALDAFGKKQYKAAAAEIREAAGSLHAAAGHASGDARSELDRSVGELGKLAASVEKGAVKSDQLLKRDFARANHALALEHRARAAEAWSHKQYREAGRELQVAAADLDHAAGWAGGEAKSAASASVAEARTLGGKLASGAGWATREVGNAFQSLGEGINDVGHRIGSKAKAAPVHAA